MTESNADFLQRIADYANYGGNKQFLEIKKDVIDNEQSAKDLIILNEIIVALCDYYKLCRCYRSMNGMYCSKCNEYYTDCSCTPLTKEQIIEGNSGD